MSENLPKILRKRREELGYSRQRLAKATGVPARTIEAWEMSERKPQKIGNVMKICKTLDIPIEQFM